jgi:hypothetical protein
MTWDIWIAVASDVRSHWKAILLAAVVGAVTMIMLSETGRWLLGKGFFQ